MCIFETEKYISRKQTDKKGGGRKCLGVETPINTEKRSNIRIITEPISIDNRNNSNNHQMISIPVNTFIECYRFRQYVIVIGT